MTKEEQAILEHIAPLGTVPPDTFVGRGFVVAWCVRRGWLDWERAKMPKTNKATSLFITDAGRAALANLEHLAKTAVASSAL